MKTDVIVVGAGLAGALAATTLARGGRGVALIDSRAEAAPEFRAEKMGDAQMAQFARLGLADAVAAAATESRIVKVARFGQIVGDGRETEYGYHYQDLVNALRRAVPPDVPQIVGRVEDVATGPDRQQVSMSDGTRVEARLLVLATGLGDAVRKKVGIGRAIVSRSHSLVLGFDLEPRAKPYGFDTLVCYPQRRGTRVAYLALFRIGATMRGNLFVYRTVQDDWTQRFRRTPREALLDAMPEIEALCGRFDIAPHPDVRSIDLTSARDYRRDGVVLVGDAFGTCCPIIGMGVPKVLTDVERLCTVHAPRWFETPGMAVDKIGAFYDDPLKLATDAKSHDVSLYARNLCTDPGLAWAARRMRNLVVRRGLLALQGTGRVLQGRSLAAAG